MTKTLFILQKVLVNYFYQVNAGLFLFAFFVLFGAPYSPLQFHYSLITGIIQNQVFLLLVMLIWVLYNLKCVDYTIKQLRHPRQSFLFCLNSLSSTRLYFSQVFVHLQVYMPVLAYSVVIIVIAFKKHYYLCAVEIVVFDLIILLGTPLLYILALQQKDFIKRRRFDASFTLNITKPYFLFPLYFLFGSRKQMLLVTKVFSLLFLYSFITFYEPERYDIRPLQLCLLVVAASHSAIVFEIRQFEEQYLAFTKNFPLTTAARFLKLTALFAIMLLPECIFLLKGLHIQFRLYDYPQLLLMLIALLCMFYVALLLEDTNMEQLIRIVFAIIAACFFIILYNPGILLPAAILCLAFLLFNSYYYHYEKQYRQ